MSGKENTRLINLHSLRRSNKEKTYNQNHSGNILFKYISISYTLYFVNNR